MSKSNISEIVSSLLSGVHGISRSETIIGAPQQAGEATVIPVHRLKIAFGAASATAGARGGKVGGDSGGHGAGGAVELEPVAAIAVGKDGAAHLLTVEGEQQNAWSQLLQDAPDLLSKVLHSVGERMRHELAARGAPPVPEVAQAEAAKALTEGEKGR
ncbi:MAG TPA: spore germination protein GerW family protein [Polyangiaceae bacterium]|nr:spore germination protein GerW family protein [Polyangiaceae bacterium]